MYFWITKGQDWFHRRFTNIFKVDYEKFKELGGFLGARSATAAWANLKDKLLPGATAEDDTEDEVETKPTTATVKKPRARKAKATANAEEVHGGDFAAMKTTGDAALRLGTVYPTTDAVPSTEVGAAPKKCAPKAAKVVASPVKKRVRKAEDPNAEPKPPAKRTKKAATVKEEPVDEQGSGFGLSIVPNTGNAYGTGYDGNVGQAPYSGGFTAINQMTDEEIAAADAVLGVHPSVKDEETSSPY